MTTVCKIQCGWELVSWVILVSRLVGWVLIDWMDWVFGASLVQASAQTEPFCWRNTLKFFHNESLTSTSALLSSTISAAQLALSRTICDFLVWIIFFTKAMDCFMSALTTSSRSSNTFCLAWCWTNCTIVEWPTLISYWNKHTIGEGNVARVRIVHHWFSNR